MAVSLSHSTSLPDRMRRALALIPDLHKSPPEDLEVVSGRDAGILRVQDWAFTQGFAVVVSHEDKLSSSSKRQQVDLSCYRHKKKTRNTRKLTDETRQRHATKVQWLACTYRIKVKFFVREDCWKLKVLDTSHNHELLDDPFELDEHRTRDPDLAAAKREAGTMRLANQPYSAANRMLRIKGLRLSEKQYYNLLAKGRKRSQEEEVKYALRTLEARGFHVRIKEKYVVNSDIREAQEIQHFFFCNSEQIRLARIFASGFLVITDATFNTNEYNLPLSVLVCVTNTLRSFPIAYAYIVSESTDAFLFMNECMRDLFFYDNCKGPAVILGDFAAGLTAAMVSERRVSLSEAGMEVAYELSAQLDDLGTTCFLQLCNWHAAEAIKKRLTREGYPVEARNPLADQVWVWINSPTKQDVDINRGILLSMLHQKDQNYLQGFYQRQEHQFIKAYTRLLPNLGCSSTQRGESMHPLIKKVTNRHTPIATAIERIADEVDEMVLAYELELNRQKKHLPRSIDISRDAFSKISPYITHEAIDLVLREWNAAKVWFERVEDEEIEGPEDEDCQQSCDLPNQYSLPCKCWLFSCVAEGCPIPLSLIHPRWLLSPPQTVVGWKMALDTTVTVADYLANTGNQAGDEAGDEAGDGDDDMGPDMGPSHTRASPPGQRYERKGTTLLENAALGVYDFHKQLPDSHRMELYSREFSKTVGKFNEVFESKYMPKTPLPAIFAEVKKPENLKYKKGGSRRRAYTGREAAEAEETEKRRHLRAVSIEGARKNKYTATKEKEAEIQVPRTQLQSSRQEIQEEILIDSGDDDDDIRYLGTQPTQTQIPASNGKERARQISSSESEFGLSEFEDLADFQDIDTIDPNPAVDLTSATGPAPAPLLDGVAARRSQQQTLSQLPSQYRLPTSSAAAGTRGARGEAGKKSKKLESQQRRDKQDAEEKAERVAKRAANKAAAAMRKERKRMESRKEDVSQLADIMRLSSPIGDASE